MFKTMTIDANGGVRLCDGLEPKSAVSEGALRWIDLSKQDDSSLQQLAEEFAFHPLTLEDCAHFDQRPKLELYDDYRFLVLHGFDVPWDELDCACALELHMFIGRGFIVTVHEETIPALDTVWARVQSVGRIAEHGSGYLTYLIADALIDSYFPVLDEALQRVDDLEDRVLDSAQDVELGEILDFKRLLVHLRKVLSPQRDVLALLAKRGDEFVSDRVSVYFRDVYDHALRLNESVEAVRELVSNVRDAYLWNASQRTNEIMKQLTILSAIFLPLAFITGFFGQNFADMPFDSSGLMYGMLASCILVPAGMLAYFVRSKWF